MAWTHILLVIVIPAALYILGQIFRANEEPPPNRNPRPRPPVARDRPAPPRPRPPVSDIDRFLEEVSRRQREGASRGGSAPSAQGRPPARRPETPRPSLVPPVSRPVRRPLEKAEPQVLEVIAVEEKPRPAPPRVMVPPSPVPVVTVLPASPGPQPPAPPRPSSAGDPGRVSPALKAVLPLLASAKNIQAAVVLHEILGTPVSQRKGRFPLA